MPIGTPHESLQTLHTLVEAGHWEQASKLAKSLTREQAGGWPGTIAEAYIHAMAGEQQARAQCIQSRLVLAPGVWELSQLVACSMVCTTDSQLTLEAAASAVERFELEAIDALARRILRCGWMSLGSREFREIYMGLVSLVQASDRFSSFQKGQMLSRLHEEIAFSLAGVSKSNRTVKAKSKQSLLLGQTEWCHLFYSGSWKGGIHLTKPATNIELAGSSLELTRPEYLDLLPINRSLVEAMNIGKFEGMALCLDHFSYGNMYHTGITHLATALLIEEMVPGRLLRVFNSLTWPWARTLIDQTLGADSVSYLAVPDRRNELHRLVYLKHCSYLWQGFQDSAQLSSICSRIRQAALALAGTTSMEVGMPTRIFLTREVGTARRPHNLRELEDWAAERGFHVVNLGVLLAAEQLALVHGARLIVGIHGAALSNLIAAQDDAVIVELTLADENRTCYQDMTPHFCPRATYSFAPVISRQPSQNTCHSSDPAVLSLDLLAAQQVIETALAMVSVGAAASSNPYS